MKNIKSQDWGDFYFGYKDELRQQFKNLYDEVWYGTWDPLAKGQDIRYCIYNLACDRMGYLE